jgi:transcriptional regulator with XRE-family HTH domain
MEVAELIRDARQAAGLTQLEVALKARTAQPAVAAYESGARTPTIATLERLLRACEHDMQVLARPRLRRGASSLAELAPQVAEDLRDGRERDAVRVLFGFADDFRGSSRAGKIALIREEPPSTGDGRFDAALAGIAELFAARGANQVDGRTSVTAANRSSPAGEEDGASVIPGEAMSSVADAIAAPSWVNGPTRFVEPWWFLASRPAFHAYTLAHTPAALARHGVFMAREVFDRV